jgi:hypothetical protein
MWLTTDMYNQRSMVFTEEIIISVCQEARRMDELPVDIKRDGMEMKS